MALHAIESDRSSPNLPAWRLRSRVRCRGGDAFVVFDADHGDMVLLIARGADGHYRRIDPGGGKTLAQGTRLGEVLPGPATAALAR